MAEREDRKALADERQHLFLLEFSSAVQDRVPSPGIVFARMYFVSFAQRQLRQVPQG